LVAGFKPLTVGQTIKYRAGFRLKLTAATASNLEASPAIEDRSFTIMDKAIALSLSAAAVTSVISLYF
jgi:hypothetical protein